MKKLSIISLIGIMGIFSSCIVVVDDFPHKKGNGDIRSTEKRISSFERINIKGSAEVYFRYSPEYKTVVTVDSNLVDYTEIYSSGNTLNIKTKNGSFSFTRYSVDVYCPSLTGVTVSGSGSFTGNDTIYTSTFDSNVSGSGKIEGRIECDRNFIAKISGSGKIEVLGKADYSNIDISGSGTFDGEHFRVNDADVDISGSGNAKVYVIDHLKAKISGSGVIDCWGNPSISGSGRINIH